MLKVLAIAFIFFVVEFLYCFNRHLAELELVALRVHVGLKLFVSSVALEVYTAVFRLIMSFGLVLVRLCLHIEFVE